MPLDFVQFCHNLRHRTAVDIGSCESIFVICKADVLLSHVGQLHYPLLEDSVVPLLFQGLDDQAEAGVSIKLQNKFDVVVSVQQQIVKFYFIDRAANLKKALRLLF